MKILITGGAGFIGHHLVKYILEQTDWHLVLIDRLDCSGNLNRLAEIGAAKNPRVKFIFHDLRAPFNNQLAHQIGVVDYIVHLAAATHVDRSIDSPLEFVFDNVVGTCNVLDLSRLIGCNRFLHFSTDEVFGPAPGLIRYKEWDRYKSGNPYAATKAGAEELAIAYHNTYKVPVIVTHTMNVIGERQHPEKFVPMTIAKVNAGEQVTIHADASRTKPGSRFYIYAPDVARAVVMLLIKGRTGDKYNIVGAKETDNLTLARTVAAAIGKPLHSVLTDFHSQRPGHDLRYALDGDKMEDLGFVANDLHVSEIVEWYLNNPNWLYTFEKERTKINAA